MGGVPKYRGSVDLPRPRTGGPEGANGNLQDMVSREAPASEEVSGARGGGPSSPPPRTSKRQRNRDPEILSMRHAYGLLVPRRFSLRFPWRTPCFARSDGRSGSSSCSVSRSRVVAELV